MSYYIDIIDFAHIDVSEAIMFQGASREKRREIGCFAWLIYRNDFYILIDTGVDSIDAINETVKKGGQWQRINTLEEGLNRHGITPMDINAVILTHAHYDHISNLPKCKKAHIYIHQKEIETLFDEHSDQYSQLEKVRKFLQYSLSIGKVTTISDSFSYNQDIFIQHVGGHTKGSQMIFVKTKIGHFLITGDAIFLIENVEKNIPIGFTKDLEESKNAIRIANQFDGKIMTSHDLKVLDYFMEVKNV